VSATRARHKLLFVTLMGSGWLLENPAARFASKEPLHHTILMGQQACGCEADFIKTRLLYGLTSAESAIRANDSDKISQYTSEACLAHDTALRQLFQAELSATDSTEIKSGFWELRAKLGQLGERL
jgi:hypothetical protein